MARIRSVKPEFWTDGKVVRLSPWARLLFIGSWNFSLCDRGHLPDDAMGLKLKVLPADPVDPDELVAELIASGQFVRRTTTDGRRFLHIPRFTDHQKIDPRWSSRCPYCASESVETPDSQSLPETHASSSEAHRDSPNPSPRDRRDSPQEGIGEERRGEEEKKTSEIAPRSSDTPSRLDVERLCTHLADRIEANGSKRPKVNKAWRDAARLMLDRDGRTETDVHAAVDWCQSDDFWHRNILSMPKLREKYEQLRLAAKPQRPNGRPTNQHVESTAGDQLAEVFG